MCRSSVFVFFLCDLRGVCKGDQKKVNYLLVLRCRLASPGWDGSSGESERRETKERGNPRLAKNDRSNP